MYKSGFLAGVFIILLVSSSGCTLVSTTTPPAMKQEISVESVLEMPTLPVQYSALPAAMPKTGRDPVTASPLRENLPLVASSQRTSISGTAHSSSSSGNEQNIPTQPTLVPTPQPTIQPTPQPTILPTYPPTPRPTIPPTPQPTILPTYPPTPQPTTQPTPPPTIQPTTQPTIQPTYQPTPQPTTQPTPPPTTWPTPEPTNQPTYQPTPQPTTQPTPPPTTWPTPEPTTTPIGECYGALSCNPTGNPIGGGAGYSRIISETDSGVTSIVSTKDHLLTALRNAQSGQIIFVKGNAVIDLTGTPSMPIPGGVTLASDRGLAGSAGGLLKRTRNLNGGWEEPMFMAVGGDNVRITGLRLEGEMYPQDYGNKPGETYESDYLVGIYVQNKRGFEVDNCELYGWAWSTISLRQNSAAPVPYIHHNYIHHNQARGEGYGVNLYGGNALIEANLFDYNRHDVTGAGMAGEQYEVRYNHVIGHGTAIGASHFDVHQDEETGTGAAGAKYLIHHNTVDTGTVATVHIRARPTIGVYVDHNIINARDVENGVPGGLPIYQTNSDQNMFVSDNYWMGTLYPYDNGIVWYDN